MESPNVAPDIELLSGISYFSSTSVDVYIGGAEGALHTGAKMDFSYIQFAPQQSVVPVYNVFGTLPSVMLRGNSIVRGVIGLNFQLSTYMINLDHFAKENVFTGSINYGTNYIGAMPVKYKDPKIYSDYLIYVPHVRLEFVNDVAAKTSGDSYSMIVPTISMFDVYFSGGVISVAPDGSPVQDVYQYVAKRQVRKDVLKTLQN